MDDHNAAQGRFRALYDDLYDDVWAYCRRRCGSFDETQDVVAEVFTVVWRKLSDVPADPTQARPWVFGVARNHVRNRRRHRLRRQILNRRLAGESGDRGVAEPTEAVADHRADVQMVVDAMKTLRDRDRELLCAVAWDEMSHREIGAVLGCTTNAVSIRVHRARQRLAAAVERQESRRADAPGWTGPSPTGATPPDARRRAVASGEVGT